MPVSPEPRYAAEPSAHWTMEALDDIQLLYHRRSGQTHMMLSPAPEILAVLGAAPLSVDAILARLSADYDLGDPVEARAAVGAHLADLCALGLAHCVGAQAWEA